MTEARSWPTACGGLDCTELNTHAPGRDRLGTRRQAHSPHTARPWGHSLGRTPSPAALPAGTCSFQHPWDTDTMGLRTQPPSNTYGATQAQNQGLRTPQPRHWPGLGLTAKGRSSLHPPASGLRVLAARDRRVCWSGGDQGRPPGGSQRKVCGSERAGLGDWPRRQRPALPGGRGVSGWTPANAGQGGRPAAGSSVCRAWGWRSSGG